MIIFFVGFIIGFLIIFCFHLSLKIYKLKMKIIGLKNTNSMLRDRIDELIGEIVDELLKELDKDKD